MITQERLREILGYNPDEGKFRWKISPARNTPAGFETSCRDTCGYIRIRVDGKMYPAHRLAILYTDGYLPENEIDHINRIRTDNRRVNLREASRQCQNRNCGMRKDNTSGVKGVLWHKRAKKWYAHIRVDSRAKYLGSFDSILEAAYVRFAAGQCLGFPDCDIYSSAKQYIDMHKGCSV